MCVLCGHASTFNRGDRVQRTNPTTDFRGSGILALENLGTWLRRRITVTLPMRLFTFRSTCVLGSLLLLTRPVCLFM